VVDLAVGLVVGVAFGKIVSSLVGDVLMPPLGMLIGGVDFASLAIVLREGTETVEAVNLRYGAFLKAVVDFAIIAFAIFMVVKGMNTLKRKKEEAPAAPPPSSKEVTLLSEIRDLLKPRG
jgi:large conductance mechanosensitive channel